jgi:hypothetical protein
MRNYDTVTIAEPRKALKTGARRRRNQPGLVHGQKSRAYRILLLLRHARCASVSIAPAVAAAPGDQRRSVPVTTKSTRRLPHWPQTSRSR